MLLWGSSLQNFQAFSVGVQPTKRKLVITVSQRLLWGEVALRPRTSRHIAFSSVCFVQIPYEIPIISQSTTIDGHCNFKVIYLKILTYQEMSFSRVNEKTRRPPHTVGGRLEHGYFGTYSHYDAHPLAFIREGENLQDGEVQYLATRGPQLHGGLVSPDQRQANALSPLHQRHLASAHWRRSLRNEGHKGL